VGTVLAIRLHLTITQAVSPDMEIRVAHVSRQENGTWVLGAAFATQLSEEKLQRYLS